VTQKPKWDRNGDTWNIGTQFIQIDAYEDCSDHSPEECNCQEVWVGDDITGNYDVEGIFDNYEDAEKYVESFLKVNPLGWMAKSKAKAKMEEKVKVSFT